MGIWYCVNAGLITLDKIDDVSIDDIDNAVYVHQANEAASRRAQEKATKK